jgi:hypothetical protein
MDDTFESILFILAVVVVVIVLPLVWLRRQRKAHDAKERKSRSEATARFQSRLLHPDYHAFASRYGAQPPTALRRLFEDQKRVLDGDFDVLLPSGRQTCYVAWFEPMDEEHMSHVWRGTEGFYSFANDGCDNQYLIIPPDEDSEVWFYHHEAGTRKALGVRLSQFLAAERKRNGDT